MIEDDIVNIYAARCCFDSKRNGFMCLRQLFAKGLGVDWKGVKLRKERIKIK